MKAFITRLLGKIFNKHTKLSTTNYCVTTTTVNTALEQSIALAKAKDIISHEVCKGVDLKIGDYIIHNCSIFLISSISLGFGAGNQFGHYIEITGNYADIYCLPLEPIKFWTFQSCPIIRLIGGHYKNTN